MTNNTSHNSSPSITHSSVRAGVELSTKFRRITERGIRAVAFWTAILLPLAYLPVLTGHVGSGVAWSFLALLAIHMVCVVIGHKHNPPTNATTRTAPSTD